jgi:hypothetical protein
MECNEMKTTKVEHCLIRATTRPCYGTNTTDQQQQGNTTAALYWTLVGMILMLTAG